MKTYSVKSGDIRRETHVLDASDKILGRLATQVASLLMGKHKAIFSRNADAGDCVTIFNAEKVKVTAKKPQQKMYYRHSNYPGGFKQVTYEKLMQQHPERVISYAVDGMLPHNHLHDKMMKRLKVHVGPITGQAEAEKQTVQEKEPKKALIRKIAPRIETKERKEGKR